MEYPTRLPDQVTIGEKYQPAMQITEQADADAYFDVLVEHTMRFGHDRQTAEHIERANLGYFAGYYSQDTRLQVERLYRCQHPIFSAAAQHKPTPEETSRLGFECGRLVRAEGGE